MHFAVFTHHSTVMPSIFLLTVSAEFLLSLSSRNVPSTQRALVMALLLISYWGTPVGIHAPSSPKSFD